MRRRRRLVQRRGEHGPLERELTVEHVPEAIRGDGELERPVAHDARPQRLQHRRREQPDARLPRRRREPGHVHEPDDVGRSTPVITAPP